jgi:hypothetical protein
LQEKYRSKRVDRAEILEKTIMQKPVRIGNAWFRVRVLDHGTSLEIHLTNRLTDAMYTMAVPLSSPDATIEEKKADATMTIQSLIKGGGL